VNERVILRDVPDQERTVRALAMANDMLDLVGTAFGGGNRP
jgi:hypothetical protein